MNFNTDREKLIIPEYGRHIQQMINHCVSIKDDRERNRCANAITVVMGNINPHLRDIPEFQHKLWDHLFIISDFKLKVDSPFPIPTREKFQKLPRKLDYPKTLKKYRYYGHNVLKMIDVVISWPEGEKKTALIYAIANYMKKCFLKWNKDAINDLVIWEHLSDLSDGKLKIEGKPEELLKLTMDKQSQNQRRSNYKIQKRRKQQE